MREAAREAGPGMVFIMDFGRGLGHTGFVEWVVGGLVHTIEGNTDPTQSREGGGVYRAHVVADLIGWRPWKEFACARSAVARGFAARPRPRSA